MRAEEKDGWVFVENVLCAVAVVNVPINNQYPFGAVFRLRVAGCNGNRVEKAESHAPVPLGMMAGR